VRLSQSPTLREASYNPQPPASHDLRSTPKAGEGEVEVAQSPSPRAGEGFRVRGIALFLKVSNEWLRERLVPDP